MTEDKDINAPVTKAEFNRLLAAMVGVQDQIQTMKRELSTERETANESVAKRIRLDRGLVFKKNPYPNSQSLIHTLNHNHNHGHSPVRPGFLCS